MLSRSWLILLLVAWAASMAWLIGTKVLPPLWQGDPPTYQQMMDASGERDADVGWQISLNGKQLGWALHSTRHRGDNMTDFKSFVHLDYLPLSEFVPPWMQAMTGPLDDIAQQFMEAETTSSIDPLGQLAAFRTVVHLEFLPNLASVRGHVEHNQLVLTARLGETVREHVVAMPQKTLLNDSLSPRDRLPGLTLGQSWNEQVYRPLGGLQSAVEIYRVEVVKRVLLTRQTLHGTRQTECWLLEYSADAGRNPSQNPPVGLAWVQDDGLVVRQEVTVLGSRLAFERMPEDELPAFLQETPRAMRQLVNDPGI